MGHRRVEKRFERFLELENFFEKVSGRGCSDIFDGAGFQVEQILGSLNRISKRAVSGVQRGGVSKADGLFGFALVLIEVRMKRTTEFVEFGLQLCEVDRQTPGESETGEVVRFLGYWLDFDAAIAEIFSRYLGLTVPAHASGHVQFTGVGAVCMLLAHHLYLF